MRYPRFLTVLLAVDAKGEEFDAKKLFDVTRLELEECEEFRTSTVLNKPFAIVAGEIGLKKKFTQRGLRRTRSTTTVVDFAAGLKNKREIKTLPSPRRHWFAECA